MENRRKGDTKSRNENCKELTQCTVPVRNSDVTSRDVDIHSIVFTKNVRGQRSCHVIYA